MTTETATVFIERPPVPDFGFTTLPNALFECLTYNLKPRDLAVLNYLLTKQTGWKVNVSNVARHCCICKNTVYAALKVLQKRGIAWWRRLKTGKTEWFIRLPELPTTPVVEPDTKKPHPKMPHPKFYGVLTNNKKETIIKKTTTELEPKNQPICEEIVVVPCEEKVVTVEAEIIIKKTTTDLAPENQPIYEEIVVVPCEEKVITAEQATDSFKPVPDVTVLEKMDAEDKQAALNALKKVPDTTTQAALLFRLNKAITSGVIQQTALVYLYSLIGKAKNGSFDVRSELIVMKKAQQTTQAQASTPPKPPRDDKAERLALLRKLVIKHPEAITKAKEQGCWHIGGYSIFIRKDFEEAGLIAS